MVDDRKLELYEVLENISVSTRPLVAAVGLIGQTDVVGMQRAERATLVRWRRIYHHPRRQRGLVR